ncbi:MAG: hypothetical protein EBS60_02515, partial [Verrucomicrobia bacterium]|nr:hypothetical protein [Verrucomicrobiota bacterium]
LSARDKLATAASTPRIAVIFLIIYPYIHCFVLTSRRDCWPKRIVKRPNLPQPEPFNQYLLRIWQLFDKHILVQEFFM